MPCGNFETDFFIILGLSVAILGMLAYMVGDKLSRKKADLRFPRKSTDWYRGYRKGEKNDYHMQGGYQ